MKQGKVYLVGAGPGDPDLITAKGWDCLRRADVVVYDRLVNNRLLAAVRPGAEKLYVGKSAQYHSLEQEDINQLLITKSRAGKIVVRLKGGDPFVLGRGGEEAEALAANRIPFEVVPGISSAIAVPAYAGIPVTHRGLASSFAVVTGRQVSHKDKSVDWNKINADTLVVLMAASGLRSIVDHLIAGGRPFSTPVAVITNGTSNQQQTLVGTLADIVSKAEEANLQPPAVLVVGEVVRLRERLRWFDNRPLFGKRVLVARPRRQASQLSELLLRRGAVPIEIPAIKIKPVYNELDRAILNLKDYHWLIFTSVNGVGALFDRLHALDLDARWLSHLGIGVIGLATASALADRGIHADCTPKRYSSKGLLTELERRNLAGRRILLPRADIAGKELTCGLTQLGAEVHEITAYRTVPDTRSIAKARQMLLKEEIDIVTFTSSSTVSNLLTALGRKRRALDRPLIACIGPVTAAAAVKAGLRVDVVAQKHTMPGLLDAVEQYLQKEAK